MDRSGQSKTEWVSPFNNPLLRIVYDGESSEVDESQVKLWPDCEGSLTFSEQNIYGGHLPTSSMTRLRNTVHAIRNVAPLALQELGNKNPEEELKEAGNFLKAKVKIQGVEKPRRDHISPSEVAGDIWLGMMMEDHPIVQAWTKICVINEERKAANAKRNRSEFMNPVLSDRELEQLALDLVCSLKLSSFKAIYQTNIQRLRHPDPDNETETIIET